MCPCFDSLSLLQHEILINSPPYSARTFILLCEVGCGDSHMYSTRLFSRVAFVHSTPSYLCLSHPQTVLVLTAMFLLEVIKDVACNAAGNDCRTAQPSNNLFHSVNCFFLNQKLQLLGCHNSPNPRFNLTLISRSRFHSILPIWSPNWSCAIVRVIS